MERKTVTVIFISGGIGNQLFQYAFGKSLSKINNSDLYLNLNFFNHKSDKSTQRSFGLNHFDLNYHIANNKILKRFINNNGIINIFRQLIRYPVYTINEDYTIGYNPNLIEYKGNLLIKGYFQSYLYFENIKKELQKEIDINNKINLTTYEDKLLDEITSTNSIAIHIRRGDFFDNKNTSLHSVCTKEYYNKWIQYFNLNYPDNTFYIFTDEIEWVKSNLDLSINHKFVQDYIQNKDYLELIVMSKCKHQIISNSSFSWWAAWLNNNPNKEVIYPEYWYKNILTENINLIPKDWIRYNQI